MLPSVLVIIPARGKSKQIPRKNLRSIGGKPLLFYAINCAKGSVYNPDIYVSSEDKEINAMAEKLGANVVPRPEDLSDDETPLDPVILHAHRYVSEKMGKKYDIVVTMQPTSPLLKSSSLDEAIRQFSLSSVNTILSACEDIGLRWVKKDGAFNPLYEARLNRQYLPAEYRETGSFVLTRGSYHLETGIRIDDKVSLYELDEEEAIDIDTPSDWAICEFLLKRKTIVFVVIGNRLKGLGHVNRALLLANSIVDHELHFVCDDQSELAYKLIAEKFYRVSSVSNIAHALEALKPDLVVNDILDTDAEYISAIKSMGARVINFEDMGAGANLADVTINALYEPSEHESGNILYGPEYFCLRDEFLFTEHKVIHDKVGSVLVTFGGTDPANRTRLVLDALADCLPDNTVIKVVLGVGYANLDSLTKYLSDDYSGTIEVHQDVMNISSFIKEADIVFSGCGRTLFEIASIGTPAVAIPQNEKEEMHTFASESNGIVLIPRTSPNLIAEIQRVFSDLTTNPQHRRELNQRMKAWNFIENKERVLNILRALL
jgi:CMP-N-acetylneuraminic acid synthetase/spore coat polysaccharide biosynthesis predicted glycosyltransferase SpsG